MNDMACSGDTSNSVNIDSIDFTAYVGQYFIQWESGNILSELVYD